MNGNAVQYIPSASVNFLDTPIGGIQRYSMSLSNACFISYRHGPSSNHERIVRNLRDLLTGEIDLLLKKPVYLDLDRLRGGDFYNPALAKELCESVCMLMLYTPTYFDLEHTFCAREYKAMESLEERRMTLLDDVAMRNYGFIIPVVLRGSTYLPAELTAHRFCYSFENLNLTDTFTTTSRKCSQQIRQIAEYIYQRYLALQGVQERLSTGCSSFALPSEEEIRPWLRDIASQSIPFPGRKKKP